MFGEDADHVALRKDAEHAERSVRYDHGSHAFFGQELYDFLQGAVRLSGENVAPLFVKNAGNCHRSLPYSGGLESGRRRIAEMRPQHGAIKFIFVEAN